MSEGVKAAGQMMANQAMQQHGSRKNAKLWRACCQFEAIFVQQMLAAMRASIPESGLLPHGFSEDVHAAMFDQAVAENIGGKGQLGIALALYRQLATPQAHSESGDILTTRPTHSGAAKATSDNALKRGGEA